MKTQRHKLRWWFLPLASLLLLSLPGTGALAAGAKQRVQWVNHYDAKAKSLSRDPLLQAKVNWHGNSFTRDFLGYQPYKEIRRGVQDLLRKHKPEDHIYVGIGRSPTVIVAMLQNLGLEAINLPTSGLRNMAIDQKAWDKHLEKVLPKSFVNSSKSLVLFDRVSSGASLKKAAKAVDAFLQKKGSQAKVKIRAYVSHSRHPENKQPNLNLDKYPELDAMNHYSAWAEYGKYVVGQDSPSKLKRRKNYDVLKKNLVERMKRDKTLHRFIERRTKPKKGE